MAFNPVGIFYLWQSYHLIHFIPQSIFFFLHYSFEYSKINALIFTSSRAHLDKSKIRQPFFKHSHQTFAYLTGLLCSKRFLMASLTSLYSPAFL